MADIDGGNRMYASNGKGNLGVTLGAIGTGLGALGGNLGGLGGLFGGNNNYVTNDILAKQTEILNLSTKIATLEADKATDAKILDVYDRINDKNNALMKDLSDFKASQAVINAQTVASIAVNTNNIACIQNTLNSLTKVVIPSTNVCTASTTTTTTT